jgi:hypothetical protein
MSRTRTEPRECFVLFDTRTGMYWCEGMRDERKRGWHLLRTSATTYPTRTESFRALRAIKIDPPIRCRIQVHTIPLAAPLLEHAFEHTPC